MPSVSHGLENLHRRIPQHRCQIFVLSDPLMHAPLFTAPGSFPIHFNSIDNGHNRSIHRHCISSKSLSCRTAADSQHLFSDTGTDYICRYRRFPVRPSVSGPLSPLPSSSPIHDRQLYISAFRAPLFKRCSCSGCTLSKNQYF